MGRGDCHRPPARCSTCAAQVIEGMRARKFGRIINISSINGQKGQFGQTNYSAPQGRRYRLLPARWTLEFGTCRRHGECHLSHSIHTEMLDAVPPDVMAKSILPLIPVGRLGDPQGTSRAPCCSLRPTKPVFITGSTLSINGGQYMA